MELHRPDAALRHGAQAEAYSPHTHTGAALYQAFVQLVSYHSTGRNDEAIAVGEQVLAARSRLLGPHHPQTHTAPGS
ncbi:tetratricopeptide repeat protein [Kitasatospora azatica]|uniref:tetratricopeptide repeat protein n=1 Tax=Kitasatospora azatica TaxID=58347 RepID=UPI000B0D6500|nr:tetratricopeptide repeat protein [Kitasatospora azatica]